MKRVVLFALRYFPIGQEGTIRHPLVARLIRLCSAVVVPDRNTANKFERLIHYDLSKICGKVELLWYQ